MCFIWAENQTPYKKTADGKEVEKSSKNNKESIPWFIFQRCLFKTCFDEKIVYNINLKSTTMHFTGQK